MKPTKLDRDCLALLVGSMLVFAGCEQALPPNPPSNRSTGKAPAAHQAIQGSAGTQDSPGTGPASADGPAPAVVPPPLFDGWPKPQLVFFLTGQQLGYIEPCGCTGLENQKGGLARRATLLTQLRDERGWNVVPLDVGSQVRRYGKQSEIKFEYTAGALRTLGYRAVAFGADDLRLPAGNLLSATNLPDVASIFVSANVALLSRDLQPEFTVIEAGGKRIGLTAVLGDKYESRLQSDELVHGPALAALQSASQKLAETKCDLYVLLAHAPLDEARRLAKEVPLFDLVVVAGQTPVASTEFEIVPGAKTRLVQTGTKAMYAGVVGVFDDRQHPWRFESVPLDARLKDAPPMLKLLAEYQERLQAEGLAGLGVDPRPHPTGRKFVGSDKCGECHSKAFEIWSKTPHARATESLVKPPNSRGEIARHFDPECLSCHVTGWDPQQFVPFQSGYQSLEQTPLLRHNGCENCHGPGSSHATAEEMEGAPAERAKLRAAMRLPLAGGAAERKCQECHDDDNSPDFHRAGAFAEYWKKVEHHGKD